MQKKMKLYKKYILVFIVMIVMIPVTTFAQDDEELPEEPIQEAEIEEEHNSEDKATLEEPIAPTNHVEPLALDPDTAYTVNELFGPGNFDYVAAGINESLSTPGATEWTPTQLQTIQSLNLKDSTSLDFPSDLNVFTELQNLYLYSLSGIESLTIHYQNTDTKLQNVDISNMSNLLTFSNSNIDFMYDSGGVLSFTELPKLTVFSNINAPNLDYLSLQMNNISSEVTNKMAENSTNYQEVDPADNVTIINNLANNYTYEEAAADLANAPLQITNSNFQNAKSLSISQTYIDTLPMIISADFDYMYVGESIIRNVQDINGSVEGSNLTSSINFNSSLFDTIGSFNIQGSGDAVVHLGFYGITANQIGNKTIRSQGFHDNFSSSNVEKVGTTSFTGTGTVANPYASHFTSINGAYVKSLGKIESNLASQYSSSYHNFSTSIIEEMGGIKIVNTQEGIVDGLSASISMSNINGKKLESITIDSPQNTNQGTSSSQMSIHNSLITEVAPLTITSDNAFLGLNENQIQTLGNMSILASQTYINIENYEHGKVDKIGDVIVNRKTLPSQLTPENTAINFTIRSVTPIVSIGDIYLDGYEESEDSSLIIESVNGEDISVDSIGNIYANRVRTIDFHDLEIKSLGELDLPIIEELDLSGNLLAKLKVKNGMFANSLTTYSFAGNQIAGPLPVEEAIRDTNKHLYNFFDITEADVIDQSRLYVEANGTRYEGTRPNSSSNDLYTITVGEKESLSVDELINLVKMYDTTYDPAYGTRLFPYHTWKYAIMPENEVNTRALIAGYSDEISYGNDVTISGLQPGENYLELSLYDAVPVAGQNENAKVYFRIIKKGSTGGGSNGGDNGNTNNNDNDLNTGDTTNDSVLWMLLLVSLGVGIHHLYRRVKQ